MLTDAPAPPDKAPQPSLADTLCAVLRDGPSAALWRGWPTERWGLLVAAARDHGVVGLLQRALAAAGWPAEMPPVARAALRAESHTVTAHNLRLYRLLADALAAIGPGVPAVVLKGAALGPDLYPAPALRPLTDIDLLVPAGAVEGAVAALAPLGLRPLPALAPELARAVEPNVTLLGDGGAPSFDLHWGLVAGSADWRAAPVDWFWRQTEPWTPPAALGAAPAALRLSPAAALLYQAAHLVLQHGHRPARLIWIYDLHLLAGHPRLDWDELVAQAHGLGWAAVVRLALEQARRCFGTTPPPGALAAIGGPLDRRARFLGPASADPPPGTTWSALPQLAMSARLRVLARVLLPSRAYLRASYAPAWGRWWPLAYPYRWLKPLRRLLARTARGPR